MVKRFKRDLKHNVMCYNCIFLQNLHNNIDIEIVQQVRPKHKVLEQLAEGQHRQTVTSPTPCH